MTTPPSRAPYCPSALVAEVYVLFVGCRALCVGHPHDTSSSRRRVQRYIYITIHIRRSALIHSGFLHKLRCSGSLRSLCEYPTGASLSLTGSAYSPSTSPDSKIAGNGVWTRYKCRENAITCTLHSYTSGLSSLTLIRRLIIITLTPSLVLPAQKFRILCH